MLAFQFVGLAMAVLFFGSMITSNQRIGNR